MGKSTTAEMFRDEGIPTWSADDTVHTLYGPSGAATPKIAMLCPEAVSTNGVDRNVLSDWIARTPDGLSRIEAIVHPMVAMERQRFLDSVETDIVVLDIPLLFETGSETSVDAVAVVSTTADEQRRRVLARPGMTDDKLRLILDKQLADSEKRLRADYVIETTSLEAARAAVQSVIEAIRNRQENA